MVLRNNSEIKYDTIDSIVSQYEANEDWEIVSRRENSARLSPRNRQSWVNLVADENQCYAMWRRIVTSDDLPISITAVTHAYQSCNEVTDFEENPPAYNKEIKSSMVASLDELVNELVRRNCDYLAIPERPLANGLLKILYHRPTGETMRLSDNNLLEKPFVEVGHQLFLVSLQSQLHTGLHFNRRIPLYVQTPHPVEDTSTEGNIGRVHEFVFLNEEPASLPNKSIDADSFLQKLADNDTTAITLDEELSHKASLTFRAYLPPSIGYDIVGDFSTICVDDYSFEFEVIFDHVNGPQMDFGQVPLYTQEPFLTLEGEHPAMSVDDGVAALRDYVSQYDESGLRKQSAQGGDSNVN